MGLQPTKAKDNIYCQCRKAAAENNPVLNSREGAAERLHISPETLSDYELGKTKIIPPDKVYAMACLYNAPELMNVYCKNVCPLGVSLPEIHVTDLSNITVRAENVMRKMKDASNILLDIAEDGKVNEWEEQQFEDVLRIFSKIAEVALTLQAWAQKNVISMQEVRL